MHGVFDKYLRVYDSEKIHSMVKDPEDISKLVKKKRSKN